MLPEIGHFALVMALIMALVQAVLPLWGSLNNNPMLIAVAKPAAFGQFLFLIISYATLTYAFISHDFSVQYVASNSNSGLPLIYLISGVWGAHEGSMLLWVFYTRRLDSISRTFQSKLTGRDSCQSFICIRIFEYWFDSFHVVHIKSF